MTVQTNLTPKVSYVGTNVVGQTMAITQNYYESSEIFVVEETTATGVETVPAPVITTDYTVSTGNGSTGTLTTVAAVPTTKTWHIYRRVPLKAIHDFTENDSAPADATEDALGKLALMLQDQQEQLDRCLKFPISEDTANSPELSIEETRASGYQGYDSDGLPVTLSSPTDTSITTAFAKTLLDDDNAPAARTTLDAEQKLSSLLTLVRGDLIYVDSAPAIANLAVGANAGLWLRSNAIDPGYKDPELFEGDFRMAPYGFISGMETSRENAEDVAISAGWAKDSTAAQTLRSSAVLTKRIDAVWVAGNDNGGWPSTENSGAPANNTWYHVFEIAKTDGSVDAGFGIATDLAPTKLLVDATAYANYRRLSSIKTNGSAQIIDYRQDRDVFLWDTPVQDSTETTPGTGVRTITLGSVPTGVRVWALISIVQDLASAGFNLVMHGDASTVPVPSATLRDFATGATGTAIIGYWSGAVLTNTSAQIKLRSSVDPTTVTILTRGWIDKRGA